MELPEVETARSQWESRDFKMGAEIEFPTRREGSEPLTSVGVLREEVAREMDGAIEHSLGGEVTSERIGSLTHGTELRTPDGGIPYRDLPEWYRLTIEEVEERTPYDFEPVGITEGTTAGVHVHVSPITIEQAEKLWELSQEPWIHVFASTSIANDRNGRDVDFYPVLRSGDGTSGSGFSNYCQLEGFDTNHSSAVNAHRSGGVGHYEWRIPEPMHPENFDLIVKFIAKFMNDPEEAKRWARSLVLQADSRLTSVKRGKAVGLDSIASERDTEATELLRSIISSPDTVAAEGIA